MKNKTGTILMIVLLSIIVILLTNFLILSLTNKNFLRMFHFNSNISKTKVIDETYNDIFNKINIEVKAGKIEIKNGEKDETKVIIYGDKDRSSVKINNNELIVSSKEKTCIGICFNQTISKVEIYLPSDYEGNIKINSDYGDIDIDELKGAQIDANISAGDIVTNSLSSANITNKFGDITINGYAKKLSIEEKCGDISINEVDDIDAINNYGDIKITKVNNYLKLKDNCGDIEIGSLNISKNSRIENDLGDIEIGDTNEIFISAKTNLGDTKINNNYNKSDITLTINNSLGDISVKN